MSKVIAAEYLTLDGVMENPAWTAPYFNDELGEFQGELMASCDALLLGRLTYEAFAGAWPHMPDAPGAARMNSLPKYVASRTLQTAEWNAQIIEGNVGAAVARLKREPGQNLLIYGSAQLVEYLRQHSLIDEYRLMVFPVVLGSGKRLFAEAPTNFKLKSSHTTSTGVLVLTYQPATA
ncbi:dihydrofolate reductase [Microvirga sp. STS02]|uniref:dihydrofolate reductase family protein n=1 Tax=Hymenobacter negativus TaxID=2795026 RepID=UPI0018DB7E7E|nr:MULTISPECIES: dihydrofolate reductase family protein [Bacteria]MBH8568012.1 dihydrofolate reductase [Hymenobacter negativus]MBR7207748.1 dihydrofolate reductase [Microvirga sp. STS02]